MKKKSNLLVAKGSLAAVACALAFPAGAAYVDFTNAQAVDAVKLSDLTNEVNWADGLFPTSDKEYRIHSGRYAGIGDGLSFPGKKLTIGQKGGSNGYLVIRGTGSTIGFQNEGLFLERGQLLFNQGWQTHSITGNITVTAPSNKPFEIFGAWQWKVACDIKGSVSSAENCAMMVYNSYSAANGARNNPLYEITFSGDMSGYYGLLNIGGNNTSVGYAYSTVYMLNRALPGNVKVTEPGRLYLVKSSTIGSLAVGGMELTDRSTVCLGSSDSAASMVTAANSFVVPSSGYAFVDLKRTVGATTQSSTEQTFTLFTLPEGVNADAVRSRLYFRPSAENSLNQTNYLCTASIACGFDGAGRPTISLAVPAAISLTTADSYGESAFLPEYGAHWSGGSEGSLPDPNQMFIVNASRAINTPRRSGTFTFPGRTLLIRYLSSISISGNSRIDDLRIAPTTNIKCQEDDADRTLSGNIRVGLLDDTDAPMASVIVAGCSHLRISSNISGSGRMRFFGQKYGTIKSNQAYIHLGGDNSGYSGSYTVTNVACTATTNTVIFASSAVNLGGAMRQFTADGIRLSAYSELVPTTTFTFDEPTRGIYIDGNAAINVTNATDVFTIGTTVTYAGTLEKKGRGTLMLASAPSVVGGTSPTLSVTEGRVAAIDAEAFKGIDVAVAEGAGLTVPWGGDGIDLTKAASFTWSGDALDVRVDMDGADASAGDLDVPLLTVASGDAGTYLSALHVSLANAPKGLRVKELATVSAGDGVTLQAKVGRIGFVMVVK